MNDEAKHLLKLTERQAALLLEGLHAIGWKGSEVVTIAPVIAQLEQRQAAADPPGA